MAASTLPGKGLVIWAQPQVDSQEHEHDEYGQGDGRSKARGQPPLHHGSARHRVHARVQDVALLEGSTQGPVQAVLQVVLALPLHDVGEQVAVERRVLVEEGGQLEGVLGGDQLVEADLARRQRGPRLGGQAVVGVGPPLTDALEDHAAIVTSAPTSAFFRDAHGLPASRLTVAA